MCKENSIYVSYARHVLLFILIWSVLLHINGKIALNNTRLTCQPATHRTGRAKRGPEGLWSWRTSDRTQIGCRLAEQWLQQHYCNFENELKLFSHASWVCNSSQMFLLYNCWLFLLILAHSTSITVKQILHCLVFYNLIVVPTSFWILNSNSIIMLWW